MHRTTKIKITELNPHVICALCGGYYVNATTIIECLHSFCRTCITRYLETSKHCPICDVMVHKTRPLEHIRSDKTLQDLVYKLVPGLYKSEMKRRREYYVNMPGADTAPPSEDLGYEFHDRIIYTEDEKISLSLELCAEGVPFKTPSSIHGHTGPDNIKISDARYLSCPAGFSVGNLKKFIRMKFDLKRKYEIDIFHTAEPLQEYYNLMDIAYIYTWTRRTPLRLYYTVYERKRPPNISVPIEEQITDVINNGEKVLSDTNTIEDIVKVENKPETVAHRKRKLPQGPDDVSPNLDELKKSHEHTNKKDGGNHKKRVKKTTVDDTVLEAMSESEEQLAKLSLDCSTDARGLTVLDDKETCKRSDIDCQKYHDNNSAIDNKTLMTEADTRTESAKDNGIGDGSCIPSISRFVPLNHVDGTKKNYASNIYEFSHNEPDHPMPVKPKGMAGRKKKIVDDIDAHPSKKVKQTPPQLPAHLTSEINLVASNKQPSVKTPRKYTKKISNEKIDTPKIITDVKTPVKVRKKPAPKPKNRDKDDNEITRKPKKKSKKDSIVETDIKSDNNDKTTEFSVANLLVETKNVIDIPHMGPIIDSTTKSLETDTLQSNVVESTVEKNTGNINGDSNEAEQSPRDDGVLQETVTSSNGFISSVSGMEATSPVSKFTHHCVSTPLYGNTPKMPDLNNIEPISPKGPEFRPGFCLEPNFNGATTNKDVPLNHVPVTNSFSNMNGNNSPDYQAVVSGFSHQDNSDQPLDLTNNGNREEYTKGKIFKTKMLRKPYPKLDTLSPQKDRIIQQNGNGYIVSVTADHRPIM